MKAAWFWNCPHIKQSTKTTPNPYYQHPLQVRKCLWWPWESWSRPRWARRKGRRISQQGVWRRWHHRICNPAPTRLSHCKQPGILVICATETGGRLWGCYQTKLGSTCRKHSKTNVLILGCNEGKCSIYCKVPSREYGQFVLKDGFLPWGFSGKGFSR